MFGSDHQMSTLSPTRPDLGLSTSLLFIAALVFSSALAQDYVYTPNHTAVAQRYAEVREEIRSRPAVKQKIPPYGYYSGVNVNVSLTPVDILDIDDVRQVVRASVHVTVLWKDPSLAWDIMGPYGYPDGVTPYTVTLPADEIWKPDVYILNAASTEQSTIKFPSDISISYDGSIALFSGPIVEFTCKMSLRVYPFDKQKCRFMLFPSSFVQLNPKHVEYDYFPSSLIRKLFAVGAEWTYEGQVVEEKEVALNEYFKFVYIEYTWSMARKTTYYIISFIAPIVLTSYMNVVVFLIPVESGERISYLVTIFVSTAVFVSFCTQIMPQGLEEAPLLVYLVSGIMAQSAVLITVCSLVLHHYYDQEQAKDTETENDTGTPRESKYAVANQSFQDKDHDFTPTDQPLRNIGAFEAPNQYPRDTDIRFASTNHVPRDKGKGVEREAVKKGDKSVRAKFKKLDAICLIVSFVINTIFNAVLLALMMHADE